MTASHRLDQARQRVTAPRIGVIAAVWTALAAVLFAWSGRFSLKAVEVACGVPAPDVRRAPAEVAGFASACGSSGLSAYRDLQLVDCSIRQ